jgi:hypothetical protein
MELPVKRPDQIVPDYSLTGDVLAFSRCQRAYRYYNGSALPPSRPVQMWYGEFIHGMMERTFRLWRERGGLPFPLPFTPFADGERFAEPPAGINPLDLRVIGWPIELALAHQGKFPRSIEARVSAYERAEAAINELGPHLFPLIDVAERRVIGTRELPASQNPLADRAARYVLQGIIDVLGHAQLDGQDSGNALKRAIMDAVPSLAGEYEIIIDYKGSRRPSVDDNPRGDWKLGEWQVLTYAWLRSQQIDARPVAAGVLVYVSELAPGGKEMFSLRTEMERGLSDVVPHVGSSDYYQVNTWTPGTAANLSLEFRLRRAIRVVPVDQESVSRAAGMIDQVVRAIEDRVAEERRCMRIKLAWPADSDDEDTCVACDFRVSCERYNEQRPYSTV